MSVDGGKQGHAPCKVFHKNNGRGECLRTSTCLWMGVSKGMLPVKYFIKIMVEVNVSGQAHVCGWG